MGFIDDIQQTIREWLILHGLTLPPLAPLFLMIVSLAVSTLSGLVTKALLDMDELAKQNEKIQAHNRRKKKAKETADKKLWQSVQKRDSQITDLQKSMTMKRMFPSLITFGPIIFVFGTLRAAFQSSQNEVLNGTLATCDKSCGVVAILPFDIPSWFPFIGAWFSPFAGDPVIDVAGFGFFYFLTAIATSQLLQKIFGINLTGQQGGMPGR